MTKMTTTSLTTEIETWSGILSAGVDASENKSEIVGERRAQPVSASVCADAVELANGMAFGVPEPADFWRATQTRTELLCDFHRFDRHPYTYKPNARPPQRS